MSTVMMNVRVDKEVKQAAQAVAKSAGFPLSTLVNAYLRQLATTRHIDFFAPEEMTPHLEHLIAQTERRSDRIGPFDDVDSFLMALNDDQP